MRAMNNRKDSCSGATATATAAAAAAIHSHRPRASRSGAVAMNCPSMTDDRFSHDLQIELAVARIVIDACN